VTILGFDIGAALTPDVPIFETFVRGLFMYLVVFVLIRYLLRGKTTASMADLLVLVLIADAAQNAMSADYKSLTSGLVLVGTIVGASFTLDWLGLRVPAVRRFLHHDPRPLVVDGQPIEKELRRELISMQELESQMRLQGVEEIRQVKRAYLEGTGEVSVIQASEDSSDAKAQQSRASASA
jgi:uncharacterized membrane protein YcaP (DUF421 family)